jgi:hypothetical protein
MWLLSLAPGFSLVKRGEDDASRFNGLPQCVNAAEFLRGLCGLCVSFN